MAVYWCVSEDTPILSGHWVCVQVHMVGAGCKRPREVTKTSSTTVSWKDERGHGSCGKSSIAFFADTFEEAQAVYELDSAKHEAIDAAKARITAEFDAKIEAIAPRNQPEFSGENSDLAT